MKPFWGCHRIFLRHLFPRKSFCSLVKCFELSTIMYLAVPLSTTFIFKCCNQFKLCAGALVSIRSSFIPEEQTGPSCSKLTTSLVNVTLNFKHIIHKNTAFFAEKMWGAFAMQKLLTFFQQKIWAHLILGALEDLTNHWLTTSLS